MNNTQLAIRFFVQAAIILLVCRLAGLVVLINRRSELERLAAAGIPHRKATGIGTVTNARGLMELIIVNIGLPRGIISQGLFAALVIMAVASTLMTSPVFARVIGSGLTQTVGKPEPDDSSAPAFEAVR